MRSRGNDTFFKISRFGSTNIDHTASEIPKSKRASRAILSFGNVALVRAIAAILDSVRPIFFQSAWEILSPSLSYFRTNVLAYQQLRGISRLHSRVDYNWWVINQVVALHFGLARENIRRGFKPG